MLELQAYWHIVLGYMCTTLSIIVAVVVMFSEGAVIWTIDWENWFHKTDRHTFQQKDSSGLFVLMFSIDSFSWINESIKQWFLVLIDLFSDKAESALAAIKYLPYVAFSVSRLSSYVDCFSLGINSKSLDRVGNISRWIVVIYYW